MQLKTKTIQVNNEHLEQDLVKKYPRNLNTNNWSGGEQEKQENYFLICDSYFWMASTLKHLKSKDNLTSVYQLQCPICENKIDHFSISDSN